MKKMLIAAAFLIVPLSLSAAALLSFQGTVTAVNSNGNAPEYCFTAVNAQGQTKIFRISNLKYLQPDDRVTLKYIASEKYPLVVTQIKFSLPE